MDVSIMFFGADDGDTRSHAAKYADILAIARAADALGFDALWTPERHFQDFGQVFPNPAVLSAALAVATERIALRAGSVVLPLHHPLRVAEDWAVIDNLSGGRVGISVATGWHSADFVLAPDKYQDRRAHAMSSVALLRRLWSGEGVTLPDGTGVPTEVRPRPRPISPGLPLWLTASGSLDTWITAGRLRANVLSTTAGHSRTELTERIRVYRETYDAAPEQPGAAGRGTVTLMTHTYVALDDADALNQVEAPLRAYLRSYVAQTASNRQAVSGSGTLTAADTDMLTEFALRRYLTWGSLLGSAETCAKSLDDLRDLGCDEVACFIDFGLEREEVLASLHRLADVRKGLTT
jgi:natural product biosynthesis luciferase-like monooxygenase protein